MTGCQRSIPCQMITTTRNPTDEKKSCTARTVETCRPHLNVSSPQGLVACWPGDHSAQPQWTQCCSSPEPPQGKACTLGMTYSRAHTCGSSQWIGPAWARRTRIRTAHSPPPLTTIMISSKASQVNLQFLWSQIDRKSTRLNSS